MTSNFDYREDSGRGGRGSYRISWGVNGENGNLSMLHLSKLPFLLPNYPCQI